MSAGVVALVAVVDELKMQSLRCPWHLHSGLQTVSALTMSTSFLSDFPSHKVVALL